MTREDALTELYSLLAPPPQTSGPLAEPVPSTSTATAGTPGSDGNRTSRMADQLALITQQLDLLRSSQQSQADAVAENTKALASRAASRATSSVAGAVAGGGASLLGSFGLSPIVSGLLKLFGGGSEATAPQPPTPYSAPASMEVDAGLTGGQLTGVDRGSSDRVRAIPQITVQVNAMDSRSFMDRSDDIARAVRQAMLESHSINDVVSEL